MGDKIKQLSIPTINLNKGGGAIKGLGETFQPNPFSGTFDFSIPISVSPCRGFEPQISLQYSNGIGNGIFGVGFDLDIPFIIRRTDKGIPTYKDTDDFLLSGALLIPKLKDGSTTELDIRQEILDNQTFRVKKFRPQVESPFSILELWQNLTTQLSYWKMTTSDNVIHYFGQDTSSVISDPSQHTNIYKWLLNQSQDPKGNIIIYEYKAEDTVDVDTSASYEINRLQTANKYIKKISYGNPMTVNDQIQYNFQIIFDYGDYDLTQPDATPGQWIHRQDAFSTFRAGFEIRTHRLCHNILMFHYFPDELGSVPALVKAMQFHYTEQPELSMLNTLTETGFQRDNQTNQYQSQSLPPLIFTFSPFSPAQATFAPLDFGQKQYGPASLEDSGYTLVDLYGEGLPGILLANGAVLCYWRPQGNGQFYLDNITQFPMARNLLLEETVLMDLDGSGQADLVMNDLIHKGYWQANFDKTWKPFTHFNSYPTAINDTEKYFLDASGNGLTDIVIPPAIQPNATQADTSNNPCFTIYPSLGLQGFDTSYQAIVNTDFPLETGDRQLFIGFADLLGDGLQHRVRISNNKVECWPNLGYGNFAEKITFGNAPQFEIDDALFDTARLFFADVDGSGTCDLIYVHPNKISLYINQAGNQFGAAIDIPLPTDFTFDSLTKINIGDILGTGTTAILLSKPQQTLNQSNQSPIHQYYDFSNGIKAYLLTGIVNNLGAEYSILYRSSTLYYLDDLKAGNGWQTRLPFAVQTVKSITLNEHVMNSTKTTQYFYHDGYYDPIERQFNGFGFVETREDETLEQFSTESIKTPTRYTKSWYHTGTTQDLDYQKDYYQGDTLAHYIVAPHYTNTMNNYMTDDDYEIAHSYKGFLLHQEIYAADQSAVATVPYTVIDNSYITTLLQPDFMGKYGVYFPSLQQSFNYTYERDKTDPKISQDFVLQIGPYGAIEQQCTIFYPRRQTQNQIKGSLSTTDYIQHDAQDFYLVNQPCTICQFELSGFTPPQNQYYSFDEMSSYVKNALANQINYEQSPDPVKPCARYLTWSQYHYWPDVGDKACQCDTDQISPQGLVQYIESAVFSNDYITSLVNNRVDSDKLGSILENEAGYYYDQTNKLWWNKGISVIDYDDKNYFLPTCYQDNFGAKTTIQYDKYNLALANISKQVSETQYLTTQIKLDYYTLQIKQIIDPNTVTSEVLFDPLGRVVMTAIYGNENGQPVGDKPLQNYQVPDPAITANDIINNCNQYLSGAGSYFFYDTSQWKKHQLPTLSLCITREKYQSSLQPSQPSPLNYCIVFNDGLGEVIETKTNLTYDITDLLDPTKQSWLASCRIVSNFAKQHIKDYQPFFSSIAYESQTDLLTNGITNLKYYDVLGRVIQESLPQAEFQEAFFTTSIYAPWQTTAMDVNDNILASPYYQKYSQSTDPNLADEVDALKKAAIFNNTPTVKLFDTAGHVFQQIDQLANSDSPTPVPQTIYNQYDITGQCISMADSRLYLKNIWNFQYFYSMDGQCLLTKSVDTGDKVNAGDKLIINNCHGQPIHVWDAKNNHTQYQYDLGQRLINRQLIVSDTDAALLEMLVYGDDPTITPIKGCNLLGQLYQHNDQAGCITVSAYSMLGKPQQITRQVLADYSLMQVDWNQKPTLDSRSFLQKLTYDALDRNVSKTQPDNSNEQIFYQASGWLDNITVSFADTVNPTIVVSNITYNSRGQILSRTFNNGIVQQFTYDPQNTRLHTLMTSRASDKKTLQDITYTYDPVGNITRIQDNTYQTIFTNQQQVQPLMDYTYDSLYRINKASGRQNAELQQDSFKNGYKESAYASLNDVNQLNNYQQIYGYDDSNNLTKIQHVVPSPGNSWTTQITVSDTTNHAVPSDLLENSSKTPDDFFDANGNQINFDHISQIDWNTDNQIVHTVSIMRQGPDQDNDEVFYQYDASGNRVRKMSIQVNNGGTVKEFHEKIYLGNFECKQITIQSSNNDPTAILQRNTLRVLSEQTCQMLTHYWTQDDRQYETDKPNTRQYRYQLNNALNSAVLEVDDKANIISYEEYLPFGGSAFIAGTSQRDVGLKEYRYTGKECDDETGLYYYGARYYAPLVGRWVSADPIGPIDGLNIYLYVNNNPINIIDPSGMTGQRKAAKQKTRPLIVSTRGGIRRSARTKVTVQDPPKYIREPEFGKLYEGTGTSVKIILGPTAGLSGNYGSVPKADVHKKIMAALKKKYPHKHWKKGHILNDNLGGLGVFFNLTPVTGSANTSQTKFDNHIKAAINQAYGRYLYYPTDKYWYGIELHIQVSDTKLGTQSPEKYVSEFITYKNISLKKVEKNDTSFSKIEDVTPREAKAIGNKYASVVKIKGKEIENEI